MVYNKRITLSFMFLFLSIFSLAQMLQPVKWTSEVKQLSNGSYDVIMTAQMDEHWHVYSSNHQKGGIGIPTEFDWKSNDQVQFNGGIQEKGKLIDEYVAAFGEQQKYFAEKVSFVQNVAAHKDTKLEVEVMFQSCDDERCLPPDYTSFTFDLKASPETAFTDVAPEGQSTNLDALVAAEGNDIFVVEDSAKQDTAEISTEVEVASPTQTTRGFWEIFILGFLGGFAALLMPCIFPMIPLTVSMFTKQSKDRKTGLTKALVYGLSIILIYVGLGLLVTVIFGAGALNALATNPWLNIVFFVLFIVFAISFFGAFEITLPSKWINKADKNADRGGYIGVFFMALTLTLVSFSCTGPIIGTLLVDSASTGALIGPAIGMFGFSLALSLPFTLFAIFPSMLQSLPSSGGWLNTVKVSLGFIELAFAMKFLSNADLVWQLHWLEREVFLAAWIAIFFVMGLYLLNVFRMQMDSVNEKIGTPRLLFGILTFVAVFYLLPGMWGAPLKLFSGLIPPKNYSESPFGLGGVSVSSETKLPEHAEYGPHQIPAFHDLDEAFAYAKKVNKPVLIDFTGDACANCRRVEDNVWSDPRVKEKLSNDVVLASLYVDRFVELPEEEQVYSEEKGRKLKTIGDKWSAFQIKNFKSNSQPLYIIVDEDLNRYTEPMGVEMNIDNYLKWIDEGVNKYHSKN